MKTRYDILKLISYHITNGRGIKINLDDSDLRLEMSKDKPYFIWHNETYNQVAAIIYEEQDSNLDYISEWASKSI